MANVGSADIHIGADSTRAKNEFRFFKSWVESTAKLTGVTSARNFTNWFNRNSGVSTHRADRALDGFIARAMPKGMTAGEMFSRGFTLTSGHGLTASTMRLSKLMGGPLVAALRIATPGGAGFGSAMRGAAADADKLTDSLTPMTEKITHGWNAMAAFAMKTPGIITALSGFISAGAGVSALAGSFVTLAADASTSIATLLTLPVAASAAGVGLYALIVGFARLGDYVPKVTEAYSEFNDIIAKNFWDKAAAGFEKLALGVLPTLERGMARVSSATGEMIGYLSNSLANVTVYNELKVFFDNTAKAISIAKVGMADFFQGLITLISGTSPYLIRMAQGFNDIMKAFNDWVTASLASGDMFAWIDRGISALKALGSIVASTVSIFHSLDRAISAAGGPSIEAFAAGLRNISAALKTDEWQAGLTAFFSSAFEDTQVLLGGIGEFLTAIGSMGPVINTMSAQGTAAFATFLGGIADGLRNLTLQQHLTNFFNSMATAAYSLRPAIEPMMLMMSSGLQLIGQLAQALGPGVTMFFTTMGNSLVVAAKAAEPLVRVLGTNFTMAMKALTPIMAVMVQEIFPMVLEKMQLLLTLVGPLAQLLAAVLGPALNLVATLMSGMTAVVAALVPYFHKVIQAVMPMVQSFMGQLVPVLTMLGAQLIPRVVDLIHTLAASFAEMWPKIQPVVQWLGTALVGAIQFLTPVLMFLVDMILTNVIGAFNGLMTMIGGFGSFITSIVNGDISGAFSALGEIIMGGLEFVWNAIQLIALGKILGGIKAFVSGFIGGFRSLPEFIAGVWQGIVNTFSSAFPKISQYLTHLVTNAKMFVQSFLGGFRGIGTGVKTAVETVLMHLMIFIQRVVQWGINFGAALLKAPRGVFLQLQTLVSNAMTTVGRFIQAGWNSITGFFSNALFKILTTASSRLASIQSLISSVMNGIRSFFVGLWQGIVSNVTQAWIVIYRSISTRLTSISTTVTSVLSSVRSFFSSVWSSISSNVSSRITGIRTFISNGMTSVRTTVTNVLQAVRSFFSNALSNIMSRVGTFRTNVTQGFSRAMTAAREAVSRGITRVISFFRELPGKVVAALSGMAGRLKEVGGNLMRGLKDGITGAAKGVIDKVKGTVGDAIAGAKKLLGIKSPSRVFKNEIGRFIPMGLGDGIEAFSKTATGPAQDMAKAVTSAAEKSLSRITPPAVKIPANMQETRRIAATPMTPPTSAFTYGVPSVAALGESASSQGKVENNYVFEPGAFTIDVSNLEQLRDLEEFLKGYRVQARRKGVKN